MPERHAGPATPAVTRTLPAATPDVTARRAVYVETYGCQMNVYDSRAILDVLAANGYREAQGPETADLVLLNTCAVRDHAEQRVLSRLGELALQRQRRPQLLLGIVGCMAQRLGKELLLRGQPVDLVVGTDNYRRIPELVEGVLQDGEPRFDVSADGTTIYQASPERDPVHNTHFLSITQGCDYRCTFCVVPATRGVLRCKDPEAVVAEVRRVVESGGVEVTLLGQNVTAYRHPRAGFADLLRRVATVDGLRRVRFLTSHPTDITEETLNAMAQEPAVCPWLHMPVQSGSDRILRRMKRGYRLADYLQVVERARALLPGVTFSTDVIVGFPGETEEDFQATLDVMSTVGYDSAFTFKYSPRPGTPAFKLQDDVPPGEKSRRLARLNAHQEELWERRSRALIGERWEIAVEGEDPKGRGRLVGRTANNRKVLLPRVPGCARGDELLARVAGVKGTTFHAEPIGVLWKWDRVAA
jgi:tRNA-2-methylthio-N6-dimethylallyladenosine synthase